MIMLEKEVIENTLKFSNNEVASKILKQYKNSTIVNREFTGVGFFTYFQIDDKKLFLKDNSSLKIGGIHAEINGLKYGAGFILFVENGAINNLEGYSYGDDGWPEVITDYKLYLVNSDGSLTEL